MPPLMPRPTFFTPWRIRWKSHSNISIVWLRVNGRKLDLVIGNEGVKTGDRIFENGCTTTKLERWKDSFKKLDDADIDFIPSLVVLPEKSQAWYSKRSGRKLEEVARRMEMSLPYLSLILHGKRRMQEGFLEELERAMLDLEEYE